MKECKSILVPHAASIMDVLLALLGDTRRLNVSLSSKTVLVEIGDIGGATSLAKTSSCYEESIPLIVSFVLNNHSADNIF